MNKSNAAIALALLAAMLLSIRPAQAQVQGDRAMTTSQAVSDTQARNKAIVESSFAAWRDGKGSPFDLLADDASWTIVGNSDAAGTYPSRNAFISEVIRPFNARMSQGLRPTIHSIVADGDSVVIFFDASGVARDGKPYANTYAWFFEMREGRVVEAHAFFDSIEFNDLWRRVSPATEL